MARALRVLLAFLIATALPLQGAMAATMQLHVLASAAARHVEHEAASTHAMHHHGGHDVVASLGSKAHHATDEAPTGKHDCNVCAACCAGAASSSLAMDIDAQPGDVFACARRHPPAVFLTAGLERPPRAFLA